MRRAELYELAWAVPISKIAGRFGLTDRGLAKLCERNHIPLPGRGYWAKVGADQYPPRSPLPRPDQDYELPLSDSIVPDPESGTSSDAVASPAAALDEPRLRNLRLHPPSKPEPAVKKDVRTDRLRSVPPRPDPPKPAPTDQFEIYSSLGAECERAMAAGMEYQRRQAAQVFLGAVVANVHSLDEATSIAVLNWARAVHKRLSLVDPGGAVIGEIRASAGRPIDT